MAGRASDPLLQALVEHVRRHVGPVSRIARPPGPKLLRVEILHIRPTPERPRHTLITCGMSRRPMAAPDAYSGCRFGEFFFFHAAGVGK